MVELTRGLAKAQDKPVADKVSVAKVIKNLTPQVLERWRTRDGKHRYSGHC